MVVTIIINVENGSVETFKLFIKSLSDSGAVGAVVSHQAGASHIVVLLFSVKTVVVEVLVLENRVGFGDAGNVAFARISTGIVHQESFQVDGQLSTGEFVEVQDCL